MPVVVWSGQQDRGSSAAPGSAGPAIAAGHDGGNPLRPAPPGRRLPLAVAWTFSATCASEGPGP
ncbi:hypothetical protein FPZ47_24990 [Mycobacterium helveticum]|uniref:Uncharacterized protein n=1 Tax=Mycobacterium helveticum TaxID=2592811 RepID=A0A557WYP2_9MYCO|nr:hypothetical protein FPZ46_25195 [Mycobacterium helveticum]TVS78372.1 hypothetical protein FPZ47_24990 [Mycobacterium helveticum]